LFDDVKKKVQKNLRAIANRSTRSAHRDDDTIDTHVDLDFRTRFRVPSAGLRTVLRCVADRVDEVRSHTLEDVERTGYGCLAIPRDVRLRIHLRQLEIRMNIGFPGCHRINAIAPSVCKG
jgi:hypothetical protein